MHNLPFFSDSLELGWTVSLSLGVHRSRTHDSVHNMTLLLPASFSTVPTAFNVDKPTFFRAALAPGVVVAGRVEDTMLKAFSCPGDCRPSKDSHTRWPRRKHVRARQ